MLDHQVSSNRPEPSAARRASKQAPGAVRAAEPAAGGAQASTPSAAAVAASPSDRLEGILARAVAQRAQQPKPPLARPVLQRFYARTKSGDVQWRPDPVDPARWRDSGDWTSWYWIPYRIYEPIVPPKREQPKPQPRVKGPAYTPPKRKVEEPQSATADERVGEPQQPEEEPSQAMEPLPQLADTSKLTGGEHVGALMDWRAAQAKAIAEYVKKRDATPPPEPGGFDATAAESLLSSFPPNGATAAYQYLGTVDEGELTNSGFDWSDKRHVALVQAALDAVHERARVAAEEVAAANAEAVRLRNERFDPGNRDTWELNPLEFFNVVTEEDIKVVGDGLGILDTIRKATLRANGVGKRRIPISANARFHTHISGGSWGLSFIYIVERDMTVTPYVYDIAQGREGNVYQWRNGSKSSGNSDAPLPTPKPA